MSVVVVVVVVVVWRCSSAGPAEVRGRAKEGVGVHCRRRRENVCVCLAYADQTRVVLLVCMCYVCVYIVDANLVVWNGFACPPAAINVVACVRLCRSKRVKWSARWTVNKCLCCTVNYCLVDNIVIDSSLSIC